jgi:hypothetical protein
MAREVIGRERELEELGRFLDAVDGLSAALVLEGSPGTGFSSLPNTSVAPCMTNTPPRIVTGPSLRQTPSSGTTDAVIGTASVPLHVVGPGGGIAAPGSARRFPVMDQWMVNGADAATSYGVVSFLFSWMT